MSAARLFDYLINKHNLKNDAELSKVTGMGGSFVSRARNGKLPVGDVRILAIHDVFDMPIKEIKGFLNEA